MGFPHDSSHGKSIFKFHLSLKLRVVPPVRTREAQ